jgi:hypothetical protein
MNLQEFKIHPKIIELVIDDAKIVETYGEPVKFYSFDHISLPKFFAFFQAQSDGNLEKLTDIMRELLLNAEGKPLLAKDESLPIDLFTAVIMKVADHLGKSGTKNSTQKEIGIQQ